VQPVIDFALFGSASLLLSIWIHELNLINVGIAVMAGAIYAAVQYFVRRRAESQ
jgi:hypothetical protein